MNARALGLGGLAVGGLAIFMGAKVRLAITAVSHAEEDRARLGALIQAATDLEESVLELRAGTERSFDPLDQAVLSLRASPLDAAVIRRRGASYGEAAASLDRIAAGLRELEPRIERLKTDVALWRLSSRSFFVSADALTDLDEATGRDLHALQADLARFHEGATAEAVWRIASESTALDLGLAAIGSQTPLLRTLRLDVERFQDVPSRNIGQRIEGEVSAIDGARAAFPESARANIDALLGNARSILDRRERLERTVRTVASSSLRADASTAFVSYERAARQQYVLEWLLGMGVAEAVLAAMGLVVLALRGTTGAPHPRIGRKPPLEA